VTQRNSQSGADSSGPTNPLIGVIVGVLEARKKAVEEEGLSIE
jgi:hypothetical protein